MESKEQSGVAVTVGEEVMVGVLVVVPVSVGVEVSVGVKVIVPVEVLVGVSVLVEVAVEEAIEVGMFPEPSKRDTRNCSTMPSRREVRCSCGHHVLKSGTISGWLKSTVTQTLSPGSPAWSVGEHSADQSETQLLGSEEV
jgi:hypothetical protein